MEIFSLPKKLRTHRRQAVVAVAVYARPVSVMWINSAFWRKLVIWLHISLFLRQKVRTRVSLSVLFNRAKLGRL